MDLNTNLPTTMGITLTEISKFITLDLTPALGTEGTYSFYILVESIG